MNKISNDTEIAVIFERIDQEGMATLFYPRKVVMGYADKKKKVFVASDGNEYSFMVSTMDKIIGNDIVIMIIFPPNSNFVAMFFSPQSLQRETANSII